ncbi:hypothetical protein FNF31_02545 [Cafeteria roenbergensis]|uniref:Regulatory protein RecX n=1 Tax=Cafeteria roenbergensis TaxID=33653 RepID=A0A5A8DEZ6_CAFRO|nr:hypothetical protein FNF31_02545 [Cafeteria roenbergensis]
MAAAKTERVLERLWGHSHKLIMNRPRSTHELRNKLLVLCKRWRGPSTGRRRGRRGGSAAAADSREAAAPEAPQPEPEPDGIAAATNEELVEAVLARLHAGKYLGDEEFARWWAEQRVTFRPRPRALVAAEMRFQHAIDEDMVQEALDDAGADDLKACRRVAVKLGRRREGQKLLESLLRKGFTYGVVQATLASLAEEQAQLAGNGVEDYETFEEALARTTAEAEAEAQAEAEAALRGAASGEEAGEAAMAGDPADGETFEEALARAAAEAKAGEEEAESEGADADSSGRA